VAVGLDEVLVVRAGPVGLTVGVELWRRGVPCRVIDWLVEPARYAKAVGVQPRTLEVWENLGVLRDALDAAIPLRGQLVYVNGEQVARIDLALPPDVPYGFVALPQYVTERLLTHRLHQLGGHVERGVELVAFESDSDGVNARLRVADGEQEVRVGYLVGADGAVQGAAADGLLASYQAERYPVGEEVVGRTVRHAREGFEADPGDPSTVIRREAQLPVHYRDRPLVGDGGGCLRGPLPGERAPDCRGLRRAAVSHPLRLFELLAHPHHTPCCCMPTTSRSCRSSPRSRSLPTPWPGVG